ncbi:MAG TPA: DNA-directed RNA polymerase subunit omega [Clostridiales bacterium]|nr:DNA-directed RNA polymerase subunit omega [Clostridiales bacterium]
MLVYPKMENLLPKAENRYTLAILVAKRARQLVDGARQMVDSDSPNLVTVACEELALDKFRGIKGIRTVFIPLRPEIEAARLAARTAADQASLADAIRESVDAVSDDLIMIDEPDADLFQTEVLERAMAPESVEDLEEEDQDQIDAEKPVSMESDEMDAEAADFMAVSEKEDSESEENA